jgi:hypothetical protein
VFLIFGTVVNLVANFGVWSIMGAIVNVCFAFAFIKGKARVRYFFIMVLAAGAAVSFITLGAVTAARPVEFYDTDATFARFDYATGTFVAGHVPYYRQHASLIAPPTAIPEDAGFSYAFFSVLLAVYVFFTFLLTLSTSVKIYFLSRSPLKLERFTQM